MTKALLAFILSLLVSITVVACDDDDWDCHDRDRDGTKDCQQSRDNPNPTSPTPTPTPTPITNVIEFRVTGTSPSVRIKYYSSVEGMNIVTTSLPWSAKVSTKSTNVALSLEIMSLGDGFTEEFLSAQLIINGVLFRESSTTGFAPILTLSGTTINELRRLNMIPR
jgi:hypothetical protein